jgi:signal transduction histidine kinase
VPEITVLLPARQVGSAPERSTELSARSGFLLTPSSSDPEAVHARELASFLRARSEELLARWVQEVLQEPVAPEAQRLPEPGLRDEVPRLIDCLASAVEGLDGRVAGDERLLPWQPRQRFAAGFTLEAALRELSHFRCAVADLLYAHGALPTRAEVRRMSRAIDDAAATVLTRMRDAEMARLVSIRDRFIAILGHDLRNPLNAITIAAGALLRKNALSASEATYVRLITRGAERMARMIADILDFAAVRLVPSGVELALERSSLVELCAEAIDEMRLVHGTRTIIFDPREEGRRMWDRNRLLRLFSNLLGNALQYSPIDSVVRVGMRQGDGRVVVTVHNDGDPIDPAVLPTIFDPFARGRPAPGKADGLGLGLFIAHEIAKAHGGDIRAESSLEEGTTFILELPITE